MTTPVVPALSLRALSVSVVVIAMLAAAPFLLASVVSERRLSDATLAASRIATALASPGAGIPSDVHLLVGVGPLPRFDTRPEWRAGTSASLARVLRPEANSEVAEDPWRNAYVVNIGSRGPVWVLSAGPNGIVETPYEGARAPYGDDVAVPVRPAAAGSSRR